MASRLLVGLSDEKKGQQRGTGPFRISAARGHRVDRELVDAVVGVLAETYPQSSLFQVSVVSAVLVPRSMSIIGAAGGACLRFPEARRSSYLYFVVGFPHHLSSSKQRAAGGRLRELRTLLVLVGTVRLRLNIAEKLRGCRLAWDGAAVRKQNGLLARGLSVDAAGDILLSSAAGSEDEYPGAGVGATRRTKS